MLLFSCLESKKNEIANNKSSLTSTDYRIGREFKFPPHDLYNVFTRPRCMKSWLPKNIRINVNHAVGGSLSIGWPIGNTVVYVGGYFKETNPPNSLSFCYKYDSETDYGNPKQVLIQDSIFINIKPIEGGCSVSLVDRVRDKTFQQGTRKLGDSFKAGVSWENVFDLIEKNIDKEEFKALKVNIPNDLEVIHYKRYKAIFLGSSNGQIFASIDYAEDFFQGSVQFELDEEEKKSFKANKDAFLDKYSNKVGKSFFKFKDQRHIYEFQHIVNMGTIMSKWRKENE